MPEVSIKRLRLVGMKGEVTLVDMLCDVSDATGTEAIHLPRHINIEPYNGHRQ